MVFTLAIRNLLHDRIRFAVTLVGIVFSIVLVAVQLGLYMGSERIITAMIDNTKADLWVVAFGSKSFDNATLLEGREKYQVLSTPGVEDVVEMTVGYAKWTKPDGGKTVVVVVGSDTSDRVLDPWNVVEGEVERLSLPENVAIDRSYFDHLGVTELGEQAQINGTRAKITTVTDGIRSFTTLPYVFTSKRQARVYMRANPDQSTFVLVRLGQDANIEQIKQDIGSKLEDAEILTTAEFRERSLAHWLFATGAGAALIGGAILGIIVGMVIVAQTLYSSAKDHLREFATLRALGSSSVYIHKVIIWQAVLSAIIGFIIAIVIDLIIVYLSVGTPLPIVMTAELAFGLLGLTIVMCVVSAVSAIVKVTRIDPSVVFAQ